MVSIADASSVGTDTTAPLNKNFGGAVWATDSEQAKHESFVIVPNYPEIIIDDNNGSNKTEYLDATARMIKNLSEKYSIDTNRIYGTGQSMGAMTTMYLASQNPDLYAAILVVDGQWKTEELQGLTEVPFVYFAAAGDAKASAGQEEIKTMLSDKGIEYGELSDIKASDSAASLDEQVQPMLQEGYKQNFITWKAGTVTNFTLRGDEHMYSFRFGYKVNAVRDWIYEQSK